MFLNDEIYNIIYMMKYIIYNHEKQWINFVYFFNCSNAKIKILSFLSSKGESFNIQSYLFIFGSVYCANYVLLLITWIIYIFENKFKKHIFNEINLSVYLYNFPHIYLFKNNYIFSISLKFWYSIFIIFILIICVYNIKHDWN